VWGGTNPPLSDTGKDELPAIFAARKKRSSKQTIRYEERLMQLLFWMIDGLVAGWLTGKMMSDQGRDLLMDTIMGVAGAVGGGFLLNVAGLPVQGKMIYTSLAAILGAVVLTTLSRVATGRRGYA
jgi:uncharacterized membrane protein YeaQ/YmgE (transglycosylase-associated protein family)